MNIFISYNVKDTSLVSTIVSRLRKHAEIKYWGGDKIPGEEAWPSIFKWIDSSDYVIALITGNTISRAMAVGQEIGRAKAQNKTIIPLVSPEVPTSELGFLSGVVYQRINPSDPDVAISAIERQLIAKKEAEIAVHRQTLIVSERDELIALEQREKDMEMLKIIFVIGVIVAIAYVTTRD